MCTGKKPFVMPQQSYTPWIHGELGIVEIVMVHDNGAWVVRDCLGRLWLVDKTVAAELVERRKHNEAER